MCGIICAIPRGSSARNWIEGPGAAPRGAIPSSRDKRLEIASKTEMRLGNVGDAAGKVGLNIDLIITDQAMPEMTSSQLIAAARSERPALSIILDRLGRNADQREP